MARGLKPISKNRMKRPRPLAIPDAFQRACAEGGESILYILVAECRRGDHDPRFQLSVAELALAYAYGRPRQMVDATFSVDDMSPEQRKARLAELLAIAAPPAIDAEVVDDNSPIDLRQLLDADKCLLDDSALDAAVNDCMVADKSGLTDDIASD